MFRKPVPRPPAGRHSARPPAPRRAPARRRTRSLSPRRGSWPTPPSRAALSSATSTRPSRTASSQRRVRAGQGPDQGRGRWRVRHQPAGRGQVRGGGQPDALQADRRTAGEPRVVHHRPDQQVQAREHQRNGRQQHLRPAGALPQRGNPGRRGLHGQPERHGGLARRGLQGRLPMSLWTPDDGRGHCDERASRLWAFPGTLCTR